MLRTLRSGGLAQIVMGGIVAAIIAVFVLEFRAAGGQQTGSLQRQCVAKVGGECLDAMDYNASYGLIIPAGANAKQIKALDLRKHVLEGLVERELLVLHAKAVGVSVTPEAVDDELAEGRAHVSLPASEALRLGYVLQLFDGGPSSIPDGTLVRELPVTNPKTRQFDPEIYKRVVRNTARRSPKEFKNIQRREIIAARMRDLVRSRVRLSEAEALDTFMRERSKAVARIVRLNPEWFARYTVDPSDQAADTYARDHRKEVDDAFNTEKDRYGADCPVVDEILFPLSPSATEEERTAAREKAEQALKRLGKKEPFGTVARELGEGPAAAVGGELGCLLKESYGEGAETLIDAVTKLEANRTTGILETPRGLHILRSRGKLTEDPPAFGRRVVARRLAVAAVAKKNAQDFAAALIAAAKAGEKLDDAVRRLSADYAGDYAKAPKAATKAEVEVEVEVEAEAEEAVALRDDRRPKVEISPPFTAGENPILDALPTVSPARITFALDKPDAIHPEPIPLMDGFAVLQLKEKELASREDFDKEKQQILRQLALAKQSDALVQYVASLRERHRADIETNPSLIKEGSGDDADQ